MKTDTIKVILKVELNRHTDKFEPILFLPDSSANYNRIAYFSPNEGHGEASFEYYYKCKPLKDEKLASELLDMYANYGGVNTPIKRAYKQTAQDMALAYGAAGVL